MAMEPSGVWKNLLSGKQAVPTVACPSCGAQVPEFRIHSHLDTCLTIQEHVEPAIAADPTGDGEHKFQNNRRGRGRGRGRPRKRREEAEPKNDIDDSKRPRNNNDDNAAQDNNEKADDDDQGDANFYWEYSVSSLAKLKQENHLTDLQKQALSACGVLQIEVIELT